MHKQALILPQAVCSFIFQTINPTMRYALVYTTCHKMFWSTKGKFSETGKEQKITCWLRCRSELYCSRSYCYYKCTSGLQVLKWITSTLLLKQKANTISSHYYLHVLFTSIASTPAIWLDATSSNQSFWYLCLNSLK